MRRQAFPDFPEPCGPVLECPSCQGPWLHQGRTEIFERPREDAPTGLHVTVRGMQVAITTDLDATPSSRRNGLRIFFSCEWCCARPALTIAQHKGQTLLGWEDHHGDTACGPACERYPLLAGILRVRAEDDPPHYIGADGPEEMR